MDRLKHNRVRLARRKKSVRKNIRPRHLRPRLVFVKSNRYLSAQVIDDVKGVTIAQASTMEKSGKAGKTKSDAEKLGALIAERAKAKGVEKVVLDRRGRLYHGKIVSFADSAREKGLVF